MELKKVFLKEYSSLRIGGEGCMVMVTTEQELVEAVTYAKSKQLIVHIVGEGTNSYFGEQLDSFLFIKNEIKGVMFDDQGASSLLTVASGETWDDVVSLSVERGLWGIENLSLIPGTVGAAPVQNIGAYGVELSDVFVSLRAYDFEKETFVSFSKEECLFGYRESVFKTAKRRYCITSVVLSLKKERKPVLSYKPLDSIVGKEEISPKTVRDLVISTRQAKLPDWKKNPNCGSFFKNPVVSSAEAEGFRARYSEMPLISHEDGYKIPAAWLIEHVAKMKGVKVGDAGTWPSQPLVIINYGNATIYELTDFVQKIQSLVQEKTGIFLEQEVNKVVD